MALPRSVQAMIDDNDSGNVPTAPLDEFLEAYDQDDTIWYQISAAHHMNLFDALLERLDSDDDNDD